MTYWDQPYPKPRPSGKRMRVVSSYWDQPYPHSAEQAQINRIVLAEAQGRRTPELRVYDVDSVEVSFHGIPLGPYQVCLACGTHPQEPGANGLCLACDNELGRDG